MASRRTKKLSAADRAVFRSRYALDVYYRDRDDVTIEKAAGVESSGSGMSFVSGLRDLEFEFKTERAALAAAHRIKKVAPGVRCMLHSSRPVLSPYREEIRSGVRRPHKKTNR